MLFVSDEELSYDNGRYYRTGQAYKDSSSHPAVPAVPSGFVFDSPASPDISQEVSGSPLKIIPRSPTHETKATSSADEDDDMDEDLLYLRLIALRSLASEDKKPEEEIETEGDNELAVEMRELLEEAEVAASENIGNLETAVISEIITLDDDDPISEMKLNLQDSYLKYKKSVEVVDLSPSYSPSQSPALILSPVYEAPAPGVVSPQHSPPLVDLTSPYSPTDELGSSPPLPPLPPPVLTKAPPPPPASPSPISQPPLPFIRTLSPSMFPEPVPTTSTRHGEPLPPGEDLDPSSPRTVTMDMEIDSGDDAEANFFLSQQNLFPASVWGFNNHSRAESEGRLNRARGTLQEEEDEAGKKRKLEENDEAGSPPASPEGNDEEEESLRSMLLAQVSKGRGKTETNIQVKPSSMKNEEKTKLRKDSTPKKQKLNLSHEKKILKKSGYDVAKATEKKVPKSKKDHKTAISSAKSQKSKMKETRKLKNNQRTKPKPIKISEADQLKFFPNLTRRVVLNFAGEESDSEPEETDQKEQDGEKKNEIFGIELEAFLKEARNSSKPAQKTNMKLLPKLVEKKIALTPQLKAQVSKLTLETKKKLIDAKITHLSKTKQEEYVRLKEMIEKKQKEKQSKKKTKHEVGKENVKRTKSLGEEEEAALRESLLTNMKKKVQSKETTAKGEKSKTPTQAKETSSKNGQTMKIVENISVEIVGGNRDVRIDVEESRSEANDEEDSSPEASKLGLLEKALVGRRKSLSANLFKLSAYMSQLQKETSGVDSAVKYIEELKSQLNETEKLLATRKSKVENLKGVIRESHQQIVTEKQTMSETEETCRELGLKVSGESYKPPVEGAENISKKLKMINNTAKKVKTADTGIQGLVFSGNIEGLLGSGEVGTVNVTGDYRSPLEHLSQTNNTVIDHSKELCRFALSGKCLDDSCQLQHLPA